MNLCIQCDHALPHRTGDLCIRKVNVSPVDGRESFATCLIERSFDLPANCGKDGKFWIAKVEERAA